MASVKIQNQEILCPEGENLRELLVRHEIIPRQKDAFGTCKGTAGCVTCQVMVSGTIAESVRPGEVNVMEVHNEHKLSCRIRVMGDVLINKA